jgi:hypothetical protein
MLPSLQLVGYGHVVSYFLLEESDLENAYLYRGASTRLCVPDSSSLQ